MDFHASPKIAKNHDPSLPCLLLQADLPHCMHADAQAPCPTASGIMYCDHPGGAPSLALWQTGVSPRRTTPKRSDDGSEASTGSGGAQGVGNSELPGHDSIAFPGLRLVDPKTELGSAGGDCGGLLRI